MERAATTPKAPYLAMRKAEGTPEVPHVPAMQTAGMEAGSLEGLRVRVRLGQRTFPLEGATAVRPHRHQGVLSLYVKSHFTLYVEPWLFLPKPRSRGIRRQEQLPSSLQEWTETTCRSPGAQSGASFFQLWQNTAAQEMCLRLCLSHSTQLLRIYI